MSKAVLTAAKELIDSGKYHEAATILRALPDDPTAQRWLATLEAKYLPKAPSGRHGLTKEELQSAEQRMRQARNIRASGNRKVAITTVVLIVGVIVFYSLTSPGGRVTTVTRSTPTARITGTPPTVTPSATITETPVPVTGDPTVTLRPTEDLAVIIATGEAVRPALEQALRRLPDLQGLRTVSAMQLDDGWYLNVDADIAPADDNEYTMPRILTAVEGVVQPIINLRVTSYVNNQMRSLWLWEKGEWSVVTLGAAQSQPTVTAIPIRVAPQPQLACPSNCDGAVAQGLTAQQAAACGLDRDGDGVACYGD